MQKATQQQTKEHNRDLVLQTIIAHSEISRAEIARLTGLTRTTVSEIVAEFIRSEMVREIGVGASQGGKSPILLSLNADARYLIGLDLAHDQFRGAIVNLRGEIKEEKKFISDGSGQAALQAVFNILDHLTQSSIVSSAHAPLIGIGIGTPGLVNTHEGVVINAVNLDWLNLPLGSLLQARYGLPVQVLNDSQAAAWGEYKFGANYPSDGHLIVINARDGIGAGIILHGQLFQGDGGGAGEIGHIRIIQTGGLPCRCGHTGCLETVASTQAILKRMREAQSPDLLGSFQSSIGLETLMTAFASSDGDTENRGDIEHRLAQRIVHEAGYYTGLAIAGLVGMLNIHTVVLTGDMTRLGLPWLEIIRETVAQASLERLARETHIEIGKTGAHSVLLGAAARAFSTTMLGSTRAFG